MGWDDALKVIGALGGIGVVSAGISAWIGTIVSTRVIQKQKAKLDEQLVVEITRLVPTGGMTASDPIYVVR